MWSESRLVPAGVPHRMFPNESARRRRVWACLFVFFSLLLNLNLPLKEKEGGKTLQLYLSHSGEIGKNDENMLSG